MSKTPKPATNWITRKHHDRAKRALERQLDYQEHKAAGLAGAEDDLARTNFLRAQMIRARLDAIKKISPSDKVLEVGSGSHGLVFGFGGNFGVGIDPLAVDYHRLFPRVQASAVTAAALGEELPFADASFEIVLSDNVIDHAERPLEIVGEICRVLKPGGLLFFTVNIHHPLYNLASRAHGAWNAAGLRLELSAFADHTVHLTEKRIRGEFARQPLEIISQTTTSAETRAAQRASRAMDPDSI
ncbi:MAG TPA: class I SAM-dependent methyltransferase [Pyrinomonadaceae bacterium]|nr:class I SAM-dependent methyltransferase [Pyrinomonadaceae bacterium]